MYHVEFRDKKGSNTVNLDEYNKIKDMAYNEYCDFLQNNYGTGLSESQLTSYKVMEGSWETY